MSPISGLLLRELLEETAQGKAVQINSPLHDYAQHQAPAPSSLLVHQPILPY